jgi:hypothetical protein
MSQTATKPRTLQSVLDEANPNETDAALRQVKLGTRLAPLKRTFVGLAAAASFDLTLIDGTGEVAGAANPNRLPAHVVGTLRCTASGTANSVGAYAVSDAGATAISPTAGANVGLAKISDDGKTITFPTTVTAFVIEYIPLTASAAQLAADFAPST